jgi:hypothetical protein
MEQRYEFEYTEKALADETENEETNPVKLQKDLRCLSWIKCLSENGREKGEKVRVNERKVKKK